MAYASLGIRLEGTEEQINEGLKRCRWAFSITQTPKQQPSTQHSDLIYCYLRAYFYDNPSPFDEIATLKAEINQLSAALGEAQLKIQQLEERLDLVPKPGKYDAVLDSIHRHG